MEKFGIFVEFRVEGCDLGFEQGAVLEIGRNEKRTKLERQIQCVANDFHKGSALGRQKQPGFGLVYVARVNIEQVILWKQKNHSLVSCYLIAYFNNRYYGFK